MAVGPRKGERFLVSTQPFTGLLFDELDRGIWPEIYVTGPSQSSKTLSSFVIPALRTAAELREDAIVCAPEADMMSDKWDRDFLPTLRASNELSWLIPTTGPGSKGGRIKDRITLGNGVDLKIMSRGGQDTNKAGYSASNIYITELKGFSKSTESSTEADDLRKIKARQRAFERHKRLILGEGTLGEAHELPWTLRGEDSDEEIISTRSRIESPCPHCEAFIAPTRKHLVGWQDAKTEWEVRDKAGFVCPLCGMFINDDQRRASMADCRLVHWGQIVDAQGNVIGDPPPTSTLWFHWWCWHNCLVNASDTAIDEWKAARLEEGTIEHENAERELCQFAHGMTFKSRLAENEPLNPQVIRKRQSSQQEWQRGVIPPDTQKLALAIDMGKWTAWWWTIAFRSTGELHVPAYGAFDVIRNEKEDLVTRIIQSLREFNDNVVQSGFPIEGQDGLLIPDLCGVDIGFMPDAVAEALAGFGAGWNGRWVGMRGRGRSLRSHNNSSYQHPKELTERRPRAGTQWYSEYTAKRRIVEITFNSDHWLLQLQHYLRTKIGSIGALTLYRADVPNEHAKASHHLCSDRLVKEWSPQRGGLIEMWKQHGDNHWGDAAKMSLVLGDYLGFRPQDITMPPKQAAKPTARPKTDDEQSHQIGFQVVPFTNLGV